MWFTLWKIFVVLFALILYASLWIPSSRRYFVWKRTAITLGWVSRLGFTMIFGSFAIMVTVGPPMESYKTGYGSIVILGFVLAMLGFVSDWLRDNA
jgi:hypothetical protein